MNKISRITDFRFLSTLLAIMLALPFPLKGLTGFYLWLSPFIMLNSVVSLRSFAWLNLIALIILVFVTVSKRWFCHNLCPAGWCCDLVSGINKRKAYTYNRIPNIGKYLAVISLTGAIVGFPLFIFLDPLAIFNGFFTVFSGDFSLIKIILLLGFPLLLFIHLFFPEIWCKKLCPLGGFQEVLADIKSYIKRLSGHGKSETVKHEPARRYILMSGVGIFSGLAIPRYLKPKANSYIRPPASVGTTLFNGLCNRCGNCIRACPAGIIINHLDLNDIISLMTPEINYKSGYCIEECNVCSRVCQTGAITLFDPKAKNQLLMGTAEIILQNCFLVHNKECIRCKESCKYNAIEFISGVNILNMIPKVESRKCVGCGACKVICPGNCITINPI
jgi:ferredoxin-type protein NapF